MNTKYDFDCQEQQKRESAADAKFEGLVKGIRKFF